MSERDVIFDSDDISVLFDKCAQNSVVFSFSGYEALKTDKPRYGDGFIQKCGHSGVFFVSKVSHWWQTPDLQKAIDAANEATQGIANRMTYGQSMGGYGALLTAGSLKARAVVTAPQTTLVDANAPMMAAWCDKIREHGHDGRDNVIDEINASVGAAMLFDPRSRVDLGHYRYVGQTKIVPYVVPFGTHYIPKCLVEMGVFATIIAKMFAEPNVAVSTVRGMIRENRLKSPLYTQVVFDRASKRKSRWLADLVVKIYEKAADAFEASGQPNGHILKTLGRPAPALT